MKTTTSLPWPAEQRQRGQQRLHDAAPCQEGRQPQNESPGGGNLRDEHQRHRNLVMNLIFVAKSGMVYISCTELIWRKCENQSEGERLVTHGRHLGLH
jgi:hypothetical protein